MKTSLFCPSPKVKNFTACIILKYICSAQVHENNTKHLHQDWNASKI